MAVQGSRPVRQTSHLRLLEPASISSRSERSGLPQSQILMRASGSQIDLPSCSARGSSPPSVSILAAGSGGLSTPKSLPRDVGASETLLRPGGRGTLAAGAPLAEVLGGTGKVSVVVDAVAILTALRASPCPWHLAWSWKPVSDVIYYVQR